MKQERIRTGIKLYGFFPFMERTGNILEIKGMTGRGQQKSRRFFSQADEVRTGNMEKRVVSDPPGKQTA